ncbi:MAG: GTPase [Planctomycetota bacterium]|nr:GTPase [Planctomycetota bacterium]
MSRTAKFFFAQVTPVGRSAIATLLVEGSVAIEVIEQYFHPLGGQPLSNYPLQRIVFGKWIHSDGTCEELVVARLSESQTEIHCHGGLAAIEAVKSGLIQGGGALLAWHELEQLGGELPYCKRVEQLLPKTATSLATKLVMQPANGEVEKVIEDAARLQEQGEAAKAKQILSGYRHTSQLGRHLIEPWSVVIAGRPNAGKSSLLNQLVGYERAIVSQQIGTTRDLLRAATVIHGWPIEFIDTAGLHDGGDAIEIAGIELAKNQLATADLVLWVHDLSTPWESQTQQALADYPVIVVGNKSDLSEALEVGPDLRVSAKTGAGVKQVCSAVLDTLVPGFESGGFKVLFCEEMDRRIQQLIKEISAV